MIIMYIWEKKKKRKKKIRLKRTFLPAYDFVWARRTAGTLIHDGDRIVENRVGGKIYENAQGVWFEICEFYSPPPHLVLLS